jgi:hypothetical protein
MRIGFGRQYNPDSAIRTPKRGCFLALVFILILILVLKKSG